MAPTLYHGWGRVEKMALTLSHYPVSCGMNSEKLALLLTYEMPYGKYKGRKLADLPGHYLGWFAREGFPSGELGALIALMYELDHNDLRGLLDPLRRPHRPPGR